MEDPRPEKRRGARTTVPGRLVIESPHAEFGEVHQHTVLEHRFSVRNAGTEPVLVEQGIALSGTGSVEARPALLAAGAQGEIRIVQPVADALGRTAYRFALVTDEPGVARYRFSLSGFVESAYDPEKPEAAFGVVDRSEGAFREIELTSREVERMEVVGFHGLPGELEVGVARRPGTDEQTVVLEVRLAPGAPLGRIAGSFRVETDVPSQPLCSVGYSATVYGDLVADVDQLSLGAVELGSRASAPVRVRSRSGRDLTDLEVRIGEGFLASRIAPCPEEPEATTCRVVHVEMQAAPGTLATGPFSTRMEIRGSGQEEALPLGVGAMVVSPGTRIRRLGEAGAEGP